MANPNKGRGDQEERAIVNLHRELGYRAERTLEKGARSDGSATWDIDLYVQSYDTPLIGECKKRKDGFKQLYKWLANNDFLTVRANNRERLYVVPERVWLELIK